MTTDELRTKLNELSAPSGVPTAEQMVLISVAFHEQLETLNRTIAIVGSVIEERG